MSAGTGDGGGDNQWYYAEGGQQQQGPVPVATLRELLAAGRLQPGDLVWRAGMGSWEPASAVTLLWGTSAMAPSADASAGAPPPQPHAQPQPYAHQPYPPQPSSAGPLAYGVAGAPGVAYAGWGQRFGAWIIDWLVLGVIRFVLAMIMGLIIVAIEDSSGEMSEGASTAVGLGIIAVWYLCAWPYYALMEASRRRATLGKLAVGIEVGDVEGGPATFIQTSVRFLIRGVSGAILGIGFLMPLFTPRRQALHDLAANTIVTVKPRPPVQGFAVYQPGAPATHPR